KLEAETPDGGGRGTGFGPRGGFGGGGGGGGGRPGGGAGGQRRYKPPGGRHGDPHGKHNPKFTKQSRAPPLLPPRPYNKTNVSGQQVFGSLNDYYIEQSYGKLRVEGKVFDYVEVSKKRAEYNTGDRFALLTEALKKIQDRDGKDALKDYDGVNFIYAGGRFQTSRGSLYCPHRASVRYEGNTWPHFICPEGGERMGNISVYCHEFGHMLGLPDLYAQPENPGMEGVGI